MTLACGAKLDIQVIIHKKAYDVTEFLPGMRVTKSMSKLYPFKFVELI
jgi:hypothetical protein